MVNSLILLLIGGKENKPPRTSETQGWAERVASRPASSPAPFMFSDFLRTVRNGCFPVTLEESTALEESRVAEKQDASALDRGACM